MFLEVAFRKRTRLRNLREPESRESDALVRALLTGCSTNGSVGPRLQTPPTSSVQQLEYEYEATVENGGDGGSSKVMNLVVPRTKED